MLNCAADRGGFYSSRTRRLMIVVYCLLPASQTDEHANLPVCGCIFVSLTAPTKDSVKSVQQALSPSREERLWNIKYGATQGRLAIVAITAIELEHKESNGKYTDRSKLAGESGENASFQTLTSPPLHCHHSYSASKGHNLDDSFSYYYTGIWSSD